MSTQTNNAMRSEDVSLRFFGEGNKEALLDHMSFSIKEVADVGSDAICGRKADEPYSVFKYWDIDFEGRNADLKTVDEFIANLIAKQANTGENPGIVSFQATDKTAVTVTYVFSGITRKPLSLSASGRSDPFKTSAGFMAMAMKKSG